MQCVCSAGKLCRRDPGRQVGNCKRPCGPADGRIVGFLGSVVRPGRPDVSGRTVNHSKLSGGPAAGHIVPFCAAGRLRPSCRWLQKVPPGQLVAGLFGLSVRPVGWSGQLRRPVGSARLSVAPKGPPGQRVAGLFGCSVEPVGWSGQLRRPAGSARPVAGTDWLACRWPADRVVRRGAGRAVGWPDGSACRFGRSGRSSRHRPSVGRQLGVGSVVWPLTRSGRVGQRDGRTARTVGSMGRCDGVSVGRGRSVVRSVGVSVWQVAVCWRECVTVRRCGRVLGAYGVSATKSLQKYTLSVAKYQRATVFTENIRLTHG